MVFFVRCREWKENGVILLDKDNNAIGASKVAAKWGVAMVTISRIMMAVPSCGKVVCASAWSGMRTGRCG